MVQQTRALIGRMGGMLHAVTDYQKRYYKKMSVDAIVNAANSSLLGGGVNVCIHRASVVKGADRASNSKIGSCRFINLHICLLHKKVLFKFRNRSQPKKYRDSWW